MKLYEVTVTEISSVTYSIAAESEEEADKKFNDWSEENIERICRDISKNCDGWDFGEVHYASGDPEYADIK